MSSVASQFLNSFMALSPSDQREVLVRLLREPIEATYMSPAEGELISAADEIFLAYDEAESRQ